MSKIFVIGLPRTGTTSLCAALLELGLKVCHTVYTDAALKQADVIADTPGYSFYPELDELFPRAKFVYLHRSENAWVPSARILVTRVVHRYHDNPHAFHPLFISGFERVFGSLLEGRNVEKVASDECLLKCYSQHREGVFNYFGGREDQLIEIDLSKKESYQGLCKFLNVGRDVSSCKAFPHLNKLGKISDWDKVNHPLKIGSHLPCEEGRRGYDLLKCK